MSLLEEAQQITRKRRDNYGGPQANFGRIASMWETILGVPISAEKVGLCMIAVKIARHLHVPHRDNLVDIAGYADCLDVLTRAKEGTSAQAD